MSIEEQTDEVLSSVYPQLRRLAASRMRAEDLGHTLQATALVHEAWIRLSVHGTRTWWKDSNKLCSAASTTMRRILLDRARARMKLKRCAGSVRVPIEAVASIPAEANEKLLLVHEALDRLESRNPKYARIVALKVFCGLSFPEIAGEMEISERTVHRLWERAKARLYDEITGPE